MANVVHARPVNSDAIQIDQERANDVILELREPKRFKGMTQASIALVKRIRQANPGIPIMLNRGYEILPQVASDITMLLAESLVSDYDFSNHTYHMVSHGDVAQRRSLLRAEKAGLREAAATGSLAKPVDFGKMAEVLQEHLKIKP